MSDLDSCVGDIGATLDEQSRQVGEGAQAPTILIVGAGPGGLFAACELLRHGFRPRIVERRLAPHREARPSPRRSTTRLCILKGETQPRSLNPTSIPVLALSNAPNSFIG
jgi:hypothetical protein